MLPSTFARLIAPVAVAALLLAACQAAPAEEPEATPDPTGTPATPAPATPTEEPEATEEPTETPDEAAEGPQLAVASAEGIGDYLVDEEGFTLYVFLNDSPGASNCEDQCAATWPPFVVDQGEEPGAGDEVTAELGTITRDDGSIQVTLDGWPLYHYAPDMEAGDTNGEGVGGVWFVARPDGSVPGQDAGGVDEYEY